MKVKAEITVDMTGVDFEDMELNIADAVITAMTDEVHGALKDSDAWRELKSIIYHACLERIRKEIAAEYVAKVEGKP